MWYTRKLHLSLTHTNLTQSGKNTLTAAEHLSSMRRRVFNEKTQHTQQQGKDAHHNITQHTQH